MDVGIMAAAATMDGTGGTGIMPGTGGTGTMAGTERRAAAFRDGCKEYLFPEHAPDDALYFIRLSF